MTGDGRSQDQAGGGPADGRPAQDGPLVLVVGSANMDLVVSCDRFPQPGETVMGDDFAMYPGGKGANQAVACAKLGGNVQFLGKMGQDLFRDRLRARMAQDGVHLDHVASDAEAATGIALIAVDRQGENQIIVASGSNMRLTPAELERHRSLFARARVVLLQLEIPLETVETAAALARAHGAAVILNPAPARPLPPALLSQVDYLTPNETEASLLAGLPVEDEASAREAARRLVSQGVGHVIVTLGERGALLVTAERHALFSPVPVRAVDTTAAGDAFSGALAFGLARGLPLEDTIRLANAVGAYSVTQRGAQTSMPTWDELARFAERQAQSSLGALAPDEPASLGPPEDGYARRE